MSESRYVERWLIGVMRSEVSDRSKLVAWAMALRADWDSGERCWPSAPTLAKYLSKSVKTVKRGRVELEAAGFIERTGIGRPANATEYRLVGVQQPLTGTVSPDGRDKVVPTSGDKVVPTTSVGGDKVVPTELRQYGQIGTSVGSDQAISRDKVVPQPHQTSSRPLGSDEDDDEGASAPAPGGADTTRLEADVFAVLGNRWPDDQPVVSKRSRRLLSELLADGWDQSQILAAVNTIGKNPRNPALLLEAHLGKLLTDHEPRDFGPVSTVDAVTVPGTVTVDPFADENQSAVAKFCKWSGADRGALSKALADIAAQGYVIDLSLAVDDYSQVFIDHPDLGDGWRVYWEAFQGDDCGEHVTHNQIRATFGFDGLPELTDAECMALWELSKSNREERGDIVCDRPTIAALREFVNVTGPVALAAYERVPQSPPEPAKATHTPAPAADVLAGDTRDPGADGFGTFDPPNREQARPRGFDQAQREADAIKKQQANEALASIDPEQLAAIIALQNDNGEASA